MAQLAVREELEATASHWLHALTHSHGPTWSPPPPRPGAPFRERRVELDGPINELVLRPNVESGATPLSTAPRWDRVGTAPAGPSSPTSPTTEATIDCGEAWHGGGQLPISWPQTSLASINQALAPADISRERASERRERGGELGASSPARGSLSSGASVSVSMSVRESHTNTLTRAISAATGPGSHSRTVAFSSESR